MIGVCRDVQSVAYHADDGPFYYVLLDASQSKPPAMLVRVSGDTNAAAAALRDMVRQFDPEMASTVVTLASIVERQGRRAAEACDDVRCPWGLLALLLALTGVYSVVSFSVRQRVQGNRHPDGARRAASGCRGPRAANRAQSPVIRRTACRASDHVLRPLGADGVDALYTASIRANPLTLAIVPLLSFPAALGAIWIPARRAAALDPLSSLRHD